MISLKATDNTIIKAISDESKATIFHNAANLAKANLFLLIFA